MTRRCKEPGCTTVLPEPAGRGRPAARCDEHRPRRRHRREPGTPRSVRLTSVPVPPELPDEPHGLADDLDADFGTEPLPAGPTSVTAVAKRDLRRVMSQHPAADTLAAVAMLLAETLDAPTTRTDPRSVAAVSKELRAALADLTRAEEAGDGDPFGLDGVPAPVVVTSAS